MRETSDVGKINGLLSNRKAGNQLLAAGCKGGGGNGLYSSVVNECSSYKARDELNRKSKECVYIYIGKRPLKVRKE